METLVQVREREIAQIVQKEFPEGLSGTWKEKPFEFIRELSAPLPTSGEPTESDKGKVAQVFSPRFCSSYFALYGDLLDDPYPEAYLARLAASGVDGVWLQAVLYKLTPFPWDPTLSEGYEKRLENIALLVERAARHGIGVYLYFNEPRAMPLPFFEKYPELKGITEGDHATLCTSHPEVRAYLREGVARICKAIPNLAGFFTITASENLTHCHSHFQGAGCPRCSVLGPAKVITDLHLAITEGIQEGGEKAGVIAWDWGWQDEWAAQIIPQLPKTVGLMSVSEWSIPINRGGYATTVGEYSLSVIGPGPRAGRHWQLAKQHGLKTLAKLQVGTTWELGAVPYLPVVNNIAQHVANLRDQGVDGVMLGWTLGGYPSPNLEVVAELGKKSLTDGTLQTPQEAIRKVAGRRFGPVLGPVVVEFWRRFSESFLEFPYQGQVVYSAPLQIGPANLLWNRSTGYTASMVGFPYDDLTSWRGGYPEDVFIAQMQKVADGFDAAIHDTKAAVFFREFDESARIAIEHEMDLAETCMIHYRSVVNQAQFVKIRQALAAIPPAEREAAANRSLIEVSVKRLTALLDNEIKLAKRLYVIQSRDARIGFEATNQYFYTRMDLAEKVLNCRDLLNRWLPSLKGRKSLAPQPGESSTHP
jgi:hypothetical protein